jgi:hypothetical protein
MVRGFWGGWDLVCEYVPPWVMAVWTVAAIVMLATR